MIPIKDKKYMINCQGPFEYNHYIGEGVFKGEIESVDDETCYGFKIPGTTEICFFFEREIVAEFGDDGEIKENYSSDISENEEPTNYERMKKQWDIMYQALNLLNSSGAPGPIVQKALEDLDKSW